MKIRYVVLGYLVANTIGTLSGWAFMHFFVFMPAVHCS